MKTIVAAIEDSEKCRRLLDVAESLASAFQARLWLLHVTQPDPGFLGFEVGPQSVRDAAADQFRTERSALIDRAASLRASGIDATAISFQGQAAASILRKAQDLGADLLILGSSDRGLLSRLWEGSVSERILHTSSIPLLIVPPVDKGPT